MKKRSTWMLAIATIGIGVWVGGSFTTISSASSQLGSADDPVVTKSYVDQQIQKALGGNLTTNPSSSSTTNNSNTSSGSKNNTSSSSSTGSNSSTNANNGTNTGTPTGSVSNSASATIDIVELRPGKKLIAKAGTQVIVRNGNATIYSDGSNGVVDITDGTDLAGGQAILKNHLLLFPRDGRGVAVDVGQSYNVTLMVIGGYGIQ